MSTPVKTAQLEAAVEASVEPGMTVHLTTQSRAATRAIQRVFAGKRLDLTLVMCRVGGGNAADLVASGLVRKVIAGSYGAVSSQYTGRYPQVGQVYAGGEVEFEHWSFLSLTQRLMAGAQGHPFAVTHSLKGSTMAQTNTRDCTVVDSPLQPGRQVTLVSALVPDLSFVHVPAADAEGNALMVPPLEDGAWGAMASRNGAVVTAEHIVTSDVIRAHSHLVRLTARHVRYICEAPFGAHPGAFGSAVTPELRRYAEDAEFFGTYFQAVRSRQPEVLAAWVGEWIVDVDHPAYLKKLGAERLETLEAGVSAEPPATASGRVFSEEAPASENEVVMALAMRALISRVEHSGRRVLLVGVGLSEVPALAAYESLKAETGDLSLAMGHGYFGFEPRAGRSEPDATTSVMSTDTVGIYGTELAHPDRPGLAVLGAAQVDSAGNMNSTVVNGKLLTGSGGSNDAASICETIVVTRLSPDRLVSEVEYVTCPGTNVSAVITERGTFEKRGGTELVLTSYVQHEGESRDDVLTDIAGRCGWLLEVAPDACCAPLPDATELELIRRYMPSRYQAGSRLPTSKVTEPI